MVSSSFGRTLIASVAMVVALALTGPPGAAHQAEDWTRITIHRLRGTFYGRVFSPKPMCMRQRTIKLFRVYRGEKEFMGYEASDRDGWWEMKIFHRPPGDYHVRVLKKARLSYGHIHLCKASESDSIHVPPR